MEQKQFINIYEKYSESIYRYCFFKLRSKEDAEDLTAEVFSNLFRQEEQIENPKAWLYRASSNAIINKYKQYSKKIEHVDSEEDYAEFQLDLSSIEKRTIDILTTEYLEVLMKDVLDSESQDIVLMRIWDDISFREIGGIFGKTEEAAKKQFYRSVNKVRNAAVRNDDMKLKSISIPSVLAGLLFITKQKSYASAGSLTNIANLINSNLSFNVLNMSNAAISGASSVGVATGGGMFATTSAKVIVAVIAGVSLVGGTAGGVIGTKIINDRKDNDGENTSQSSSESTSSKSSSSQSSQDEASSSVSNESCKVKTYSNPTYPNFSFEYDSCEWTLTETIDTEGEFYPKSAVIVLKQKNNNTLDISLRTGFDAFPSCFNGNYTDIGNTTYRIMNNDGDYEYRDELYEKGSSYWQSIVDSFTGLNYGGTDYCVVGEQAFITLSNVISSEGIGVDKGKAYPVFVAIKFSGDNVEFADEFVKQIKY